LQPHSITLADVTVSHGVTEVFGGVSLTVGAGSRIGVVGPNGAGKTTLLRLLAGLEEPERGVVRLNPRDLLVGYLPQELDARPGESLRAYLERRTSPSETRLASVAAELGLDLGGRLDEFSGGQVARARLAALSLARYDVYCLDEPTNDLDFDGLERLERFVEGVRGSVVVVSHDREFLDRIVDRIVELEEGTRRLREWTGGWSEFEAARERERTARYRRYEEAEERRREIDALLRQRRGQARAGTKLGKQTGGADRRPTKALKSKVRQAERALERLDRPEKPFEPWELRLELEPAARSGELVVRLEQVAVERNGFRLGPIDLELYRGDRVAVVGPNGSGKTTLLGALTGTLPLASGRREVGRGVVFGELDQTRARFTVDDPLVIAFGGPQETARTLLAKFGLGADEVLRPARTLSPGERTRAQLAFLAAAGVNCLILDEPTNHLDLPAIEEFERTLDRYPATVVLVTHDRRLLERFAPTRRIEL
jgi:ATPase subunit of ABC transporter with duplicated ATPase domains